jgi:hypothetical protein
MLVKTFILMTDSKTNQQQEEENPQTPTKTRNSYRRRGDL